MMYNYFFKVGDIVFSINCNIKIKFPINYAKFIIKDKNLLQNFSVNIILSSEPSINHGVLLIKQRTYKWIQAEENLYYIFTRRNAELDNDKAPWVLEIYKKNCNLYIPTDKIDTEFFERPWIHRLFSYFLPNNYVLSHGGCLMIKDEGCLILGECGKGKSTFLNFAYSLKYTTLCDDRILLKFYNGKLFCFSTPWNHKNPQLITNKFCTVKCFCFLEHSLTNNNMIVLLDQKKDIKKAISQLYLPIPKNQLYYYTLFLKEILKLSIPIVEYHFVPKEQSVQEFIHEFQEHFSSQKANK